MQFSEKAQAISVFVRYVGAYAGMQAFDDAAGKDGVNVEVVEKRHYIRFEFEKVSDVSSHAKRFPFFGQFRQWKILGKINFGDFKQGQIFVFSAEVD